MVAMPGRNKWRTCQVRPALHILQAVWRQMFHHMPPYIAVAGGKVGAGYPPIGGGVIGGSGKTG